MKRKAIWNPVNPETIYKEYEKHVESVLEKQFNEPSYLSSLYKHLINDLEIRKLLENVHLQRRTIDKPTWAGASGHEHQIDVSFSTEDEKVILLVECKHWTKSVDFPTFSAFLVRVIDITTLRRNSVVLGMLVSTQGLKGKAGGKGKDHPVGKQTYTDDSRLQSEFYSNSAVLKDESEDQDCIAKIRTQFNEMGYYISDLWLPE